MKKLSAVLLALSLVLAVTACDGDKGNTSSAGSTGSTPSETSSIVSDETSSEELGNTLTADEIAAVVALAQEKPMDGNGDFSMKMAMEVKMVMTGMTMDMTVEGTMAQKGTGDDFVALETAKTNMLGMESYVVEYFKDGKFYTMTLTGTETDGYYEEMTAEEFQAKDEGNEDDGEDGDPMADLDELFTEDELKKATVVRENGKKIVTMDSESDAMKKMAAAMLESMDLAESGSEADIDKLEISFVLDENNKYTGIDMLVECTMATQEDGVSMEMAITMDMSFTDMVYGEGAVVTIEAPEGIEDLPSSEEYWSNYDFGDLEDMFGEDNTL